MVSRTSDDRISAWEQVGEQSWEQADSNDVRAPGAAQWAATGAASGVSGSGSVAWLEEQGDSAPRPATTVATTSSVSVQADKGDDPRPNDEEILSQHNNIRNEEAKKISYLGDREDLSSLIAEYEGGSVIFVRKIEAIQGKYGKLRRARGDGNCFFRSFIFAFLERLLTYGGTAEAQGFSSVIRGWRDKLTEGGYQELVFEDSMTMILELVDAIRNQKGKSFTLADLERNFRDDIISNMVVMLLRMITSCEIQRRRAFFEPFILGMTEEPISVESFCQRYVEVMGEESDHVHIVALTDALQLPVRVMYLDSSSAAAGAAGAEGEAVSSHDFLPESLQQKDTVPSIHLLYRPGHYDILYPQH